MSLLTAPVPEALIKELEERFPAKRHTPDESLPVIMEYSGRLALVEYLRNSYNEQQNDVFEK